jgi:hypothetical protein
MQYHSLRYNLSPRKKLILKVRLFVFFLLAYTTSAEAASLRSCQNLFLRIKAKNIETLLEEYEAKGNPVISSRRLQFNGTDGRDVYNQTAKFIANFEGQPVAIKLGRVEPRQNHESEVWIFKYAGQGVYDPIRSIQPFKGEDPFYQFIDGELFVGFVETFKRNDSGDLGYRTAFYRDHHLGVDHLTRFATGPEGMKDIRFAQIPAGPSKGKIRLVARPQSNTPDKGGRGKNSFTDIDTIEHLNAASISKSIILHGQVPEDQWIGTNHIYPLSNGDVVYLSHVAYFVNKRTGLRNYFISIYSDRFPNPRIILIRKDIELTMDSALKRQGYKRVDLINVLFAGGLRRLPNGKAVLDVGAGDAEAWEVTIPDPILWYESQSALY